MSISELTLHNVLRTYSRQERLGQMHRVRGGGATPARSADLLTLSPGAQKAAWMGQLAAQVVERQLPDLGPEERPARVQSTKAELLARHRDELGDDTLSLEALEERLRSLYLG